VIFIIKCNSHYLSIVIAYTTSSTNISVHSTSIQQLLGNSTILVIGYSVRSGRTSIVNNSYLFFFAAYCSVQCRTSFICCEDYINITNLSDILDVISAEEVFYTSHCFVKFQYARSSFRTILCPSCERRIQIINKCTVSWVIICRATWYGNIKLGISFVCIPIVGDEVGFCYIVRLLDIFYRSFQYQFNISTCLIFTCIISYTVSQLLAGIFPQSVFRDSPFDYVSSLSFCICCFFTSTQICRSLVSTIVVEIRISCVELFFTQTDFIVYLNVHILNC